MLAHKPAVSLETGVSWVGRVTYPECIAASLPLLGIQNPLQWPWLGIVGSWQKMDGFHSDYSKQIKGMMENDLGDTALPSSYLSFSTDTYFKCSTTWGIAPMQILPDRFSTLTTSISDSAPQIGNRPLRKHPHLWGHISIQPAVLNGKKKILSHLTLCFSVITPAMSICGPHYGLFPSVYASKNVLSPRFSMGESGPSASVNC